jgi:hypothetical protein
MTVPYANLRTIIARAENIAAGRQTVELGVTDNVGMEIALTLMEQADPLYAQIPTKHTGRQELNKIQSVGARWLTINGHTCVRLSYERATTGVVWFLTVKEPK